MNRTRTSLRKKGANMSELYEKKWLCYDQQPETGLLLVEAEESVN